MTAPATAPATAPTRRAGLAERGPRRTGSMVTGASLAFGVGSMRWRVRPRRAIVLAGLVLALLVATVVTLGTGAYHVAPDEVLRALVGRADPGSQFIVGTLRLPRLVTGLAVGAALGIGGALFQGLIRNPLASPDIVGFDTGAATGALLVILVWHGGATSTAAGAVGGGLATAAVVSVLAFRGMLNGARLVLMGIGLAAMLVSVNSYLLTRANLADARSAAVWLLGSLNDASWSRAVPVLILLAVAAPCCVRLGRDLGALALGDDAAGGLGVRLGLLRPATVLVAVALTAAATAAAGPVTFVALAAPQIARRMTRGSSTEIAGAALTGALLLCLSDLVAQRLLPGELPVGVVTGAVGGIYLIVLLVAQWRRGRG